MFAADSALRTRHVTMQNPVEHLCWVRKTCLARRPSFLDGYFYLLEEKNYLENNNVWTGVFRRPEFSSRNSWFSRSELPVIKQNSRSVLQNFSFSSLLSGVAIYVACVKGLWMWCTGYTSRILTVRWLILHPEKWRFSCLLVTVGGWNM
jgi:hypothetical protein